MIFFCFLVTEFQRAFFVNCAMIAYCVIGLAKFSLTLFNTLYENVTAVPTKQNSAANPNKLQLPSLTDACSIVGLLSSCQRAEHAGRCHQIIIHSRYDGASRPGHTGTVGCLVLQYNNRRNIQRHAAIPFNVAGSLSYFATMATRRFIF